MSTIAQTESTHGRLNLRAFLAGSGATVALVAGIVIAFLAIGALVVFDELPLGGGDDDATVVEIGTAERPERAAAALAGASRAVAASPAAATASGEAPRASGGGGGVLGAAPGDQGSSLLPAIGTGPGADGGGTLGDTIRGTGDEAANAGVELPLSDLTGDATRPLDDAVGGLSGGLEQPPPSD